MRRSHLFAPVCTLLALTGSACGSGSGPLPSASTTITVPGGGTADDVTSPSSTPDDDGTDAGTTGSSEASSSTSTSSTAAPTTTAPAVPGSLLALDVLAFIAVANERPDGYVRDLFGYPADLDRDGCDTRSEVLQRDTLSLPQIDAITCRVIEGDWYSPYDDLTFERAEDIDIDHVVALKEAWDSGAWQWANATKVAFANDVTDRRTLIAVSSDSNVSKSDKDPSNWLPTNADDVCRYIGDWVSIKARWQLTMDQSEYGRVRNLLNGSCAGLRIAPFAAAPASLTPVSPGTPPPPSDVYYANCAEARAAGAAPLLVGEPGYRAALDRDRDGVACE